MSSMRHLCSAFLLLADSVIVSDVDFRNRLGMATVLLLVTTPVLVVLVTTTVL